MTESYRNVLETVGSTPMVELGRLAEEVPPRLLAKLEFLNPGGSIKDRVAVAIVEEAERTGALQPGGTLVEATSGNTGVGLAMVAARKGYRAIFAVPDKVCAAKIQALKAFGAQVVITPASAPPESPESCYSVARRIAEETPNAVLADQYFNPVNPETHYRSTAPEIWAQTGGRIDALVTGMGTGGTISGIGRFLKEKDPRIRVVGADPVGSVFKAFFETGELIQPHPYKVEGVGEDLIPGTTHFEFIDEIITVSDREAFQMARRLTCEEGIFAGGSSGLALVAGLKVARQMQKGQVVVVLMPDGGIKYLATFFSDEWLAEHDLLEPARA